MYFKLLIKHALLKYLKLKPELKKFLFFQLDRAIKYSARGPICSLLQFKSSVFVIIRLMLFVFSCPKAIILAVSTVIKNSGSRLLLSLWDREKPDNINLVIILSELPFPTSEAQL